MKLKITFIICIYLLACSLLMSQAQTIMHSGVYGQELRSHDGNAYYSAPDSASSSVLHPWFNNGTAAGTLKLKSSTGGMYAPSGYTKAGNTVFFQFDDGVNNAQLWKTDGTSAGTVMVKKINPNGIAVYLSSNADMTAFNNMLVFSADDGVKSYEPWKSDGTAAGTVMIQNLQPLANYGANPRNFSVINNKVVYIVNSSWISGPFEFYSYDGTTNTKISSSFSGYYTFTSAPVMQIANKIYFLGNDNNNMTTVFATDGNTVTNPMQFLGTRQMVNIGSTILFDEFNVATGYELHKCDLNFQNDVIVKDILPGGGAIHNVFNLTVLNNIAYFQADDGTNGTELWRSDGTTAGTYMVKDINPGSASSMAYSAFTHTKQFLENCNKLYFLANDGTHGDELWVTDGTSAGTQLVMDINTGSGSPNITQIAASQGRIYLFASDANNVSSLYKIEDCFTAAAPAAPTSLVVTPMKVQVPGSMKLTWTDNSNNETGFKIERSNNGTSGWTLIDSVGANSGTYTQTGLPNSTAYYYRVYAYNGGGKSGYSNVAGGTTLGITDNEKVTIIRVFPNPAQNQINFGSLSKKGNASVYNLTGKLCYEQYLETGEDHINIETLPVGIYLLEISSGNEVTMRGRFVKN